MPLEPNGRDRVTSAVATGVAVLPMLVSPPYVLLFENPTGPAPTTVRVPDPPITPFNVSACRPVMSLRNVALLHSSTSALIVWPTVLDDDACTTAPAVLAS